ncbi:MAG: NADH-quinone oxidoreductase subunit M [Anaerolineae bacterium]|nr:MAG: NADH-quinone oxidoreductase subunit M [Anaerolineae bacterium]
MGQPDFPLLSLIVFLPLAGALILLVFFKDTQRAAVRWWALLVSVVEFVISLRLLLGWQTIGEMQFVDGPAAWIPELDVNYLLGVDGISLFLVLLTAFLTMLAVLASWGFVAERERSYYFWLLLLETGSLGVFLALDTVLFYVFWEAVLVPMYFLIGRWGSERRVYAALKFFLYTMSGSVLMLVAIIVLYFAGGSFNLLALYDGPALPPHLQTWLFLAFALAFAIKVPLFPFHTWLPDAHVQAPAAGSVLLAGVLLKMGAYGFLRFCLPLFPEAAVSFAPLLVVLSIVGIIYGALVALSQRDVKSLVAYSSISHLGLVVLGIFVFNEQGLMGSVLQMVNHGLSTGALFLLVGMLYARRHTRLIEAFGGLWKQMPRFGLFLLIATLASIGLPGLNGFVGEFTILMGAVRARPLYAVFATSGIVLGAWYMLTLFRRVMHGPLEDSANRELPDLSTREVLVLVPIALLILAIGILPGLLLARMEPSVTALLNRIGPVIVSLK